MSEVKQYADRDAMALDEAGGYYMRHVMAMTGEQLHGKGDIAAELGWRDMQIAALQQKLDAVLAGVVGVDAGGKNALIDHLEKCSEIVSRWPEWKKKGSDATKFIQELDDFEIGYLNGHAEACANRTASAIDLNEIRAEGASAVADYHKERFEFLGNTCREASGEHKAAYLCALDVAAQLRAGCTEGGV